MLFVTTVLCDGDIVALIRIPTEGNTEEERFNMHLTTHFIVVDYCMNPRIEGAVSWGRLLFYEISFKSSKPVPPIFGCMSDLRRKLEGAGLSSAPYHNAVWVWHSVMTELAQTFLNPRNCELRVIRTLQGTSNLVSMAIIKQEDMSVI
jgi:hypothetical protein